MACAEVKPAAGVPVSIYAIKREKTVRRGASAEHGDSWKAVRCLRFGLTR